MSKTTTPTVPPYKQMPNSGNDFGFIVLLAVAIAAGIFFYHIFF